MNGGLPMNNLKIIAIDFIINDETKLAIEIASRTLTHTRKHDPDDGFGEYCPPVDREFFIIMGNPLGMVILRALTAHSTKL